jgi:DME family drug/metabolite transporter
VSIVSTGGDLGRLFDGSLTGNLLVFMAGIVWAFYIVYQKKSLAKYPDVIMMTSALAMTTTVACLPMSLLFANSYFLPMEGLLTAAYLGLVCTGGAFLLYMAGLKGKGATESTIILLLEIVFAMLFAFLLLREVPTLFTAAGGAMIVAAIVLVSLYENNGKRNREA